MKQKCNYLGVCPSAYKTKRCLTHPESCTIHMKKSLLDRVSETHIAPREEDILLGIGAMTYIPRRMLRFIGGGR